MFNHLKARYSTRGRGIVQIVPAPVGLTVTGVRYDDLLQTVPVLAFGLTKQGWTVAMIAIDGPLYFDSASLVPATCLFENYEINEG